MSPEESGNALGGGARALSADEVRQRRLAALGSRGGGGRSSANESRPPSKKPPPAEAAPGKGVAEATEEMELPGSFVPAKTGPPEPFDIGAFHSIMWDSSITTDNDKNRWVGQEINTRMSDDGEGTPALSHHKTRLEAIGASHIPWGLTQQHGGPCGVLAAVQVEMLRLLLFGSRAPMDYPSTLPEESLPPDPSITPALIEEGLALAIALILARASIVAPAFDAKPSAARESTLAKLVLPSQPTPSGLTWHDLEPWSAPPSSMSSSLIVKNISDDGSDAGCSTSSSSQPKRQRVGSKTLSQEDRIVSLAHRIASVLLDKSEDGSCPLDCFRRPGGVLLLVMSLVGSRGTSSIQQEFDDVGAKLTSQFGHCSQELINLLLTGQAVSNVFDNTVQLSGDLTCRGIQKRPACGYLSQLESLRYCEVGGYYKSPRFPVWIIGSSSHFTVLMGDIGCLKESKSDELLEKCRRAWKAQDGDSAGFIQKEALGPVLEACGAGPEIMDKLSTLAATLEVSGAGIILFDEFWKTTSRLLMGASIEAVLQGEDDLDDLPALIHLDDNDNNTNNNNIKKLDPAAAETVRVVGGHLPMLTNEPHNTPAAAAVPETRQESDEEMARRLAKEWANEITPSTSNLKTSPVAAAAAAPSEQETGMSSDEALARRLQAEWNAEEEDGDLVGLEISSAAGVVGGSSPNRHATDTDEPTVTSMEEDGDEKMPALEPPDVIVTKLDDHGDAATADASTDNSTKPRLEFEKHGDSFSMYHYNGLRGGTLTNFLVTRLTAEEAVGSSVGLGNAPQAAGSGGGGGGGDLEDVVRTKWPSCVINWLGKNAPYID